MSGHEQHHGTQQQGGEKQWQRCRANAHVCRRRRRGRRPRWPGGPWSATTPAAAAPAGLQAIELKHNTHREESKTTKLNDSLRVGRSGTTDKSRTAATHERSRGRAAQTDAFITQHTETDKASLRAQVSRTVDLQRERGRGGGSRRIRDLSQRTMLSQRRKTQQLPNAVQERSQEKVQSSLRLIALAA